MDVPETENPGFNADETNSHEILMDSMLDNINDIVDKRIQQRYPHGYNVKNGDDENVVSYKLK